MAGEMDGVTAGGLVCRLVVRSWLMRQTTEDSQEEFGWSCGVFVVQLAGCLVGWLVGVMVAYMVHGWWYGCSGGSGGV